MNGNLRTICLLSLMSWKIGSLLFEFNKKEPVCKYGLHPNLLLISGNDGTKILSKSSKVNSNFFTNNFSLEPYIAITLQTDVNEKDAIHNGYYTVVAVDCNTSKIDDQTKIYWLVVNVKGSDIYNNHKVLIEESGSKKRYTLKKWSGLFLSSSEEKYCLRVCLMKQKAIINVKTLNDGTSTASIFVNKIQNNICPENVELVKHDFKAIINVE